MYDIEVESGNTARLYPAGEPRGYARVRTPEAWVLAAPEAGSARLSQYTYGEPLRLYAEDGDYIRTQSLRDHYSGWVALNALEPVTEAPAACTHITTAIAPVTAEPDLKSPYRYTLPQDACLTPAAENGDYLQLPEDGWLHRRHTAPINSRTDPIAAARSQLGRSYVWGGRGIAGLDCSALSQWVYRRAGCNIPRDSDLQALYLKAHHKRVELGELTRGDLIYLPGHVMIAADPYTVIHASGHHMQVVVENLSEAITRYKRALGSSYHLHAYRWDAKESFVHTFD